MFKCCGLVSGPSHVWKESLVFWVTFLVIGLGCSLIWGLGLDCRMHINYICIIVSGETWLEKLVLQHLLSYPKSVCKPYIPSNHDILYAVFPAHETRNVAWGTRPSFCFLGRSGDKTSFRGQHLFSIFSAVSAATRTGQDAERCSWILHCRCVFLLAHTGHVLNVCGLHQSSYEQGFWWANWCEESSWA